MASNIYALTISYECSNQFAANVLHYQFDDSGFETTASAADALATEFDTAKRTLLMAALPASTTLLSYKARRVSESGGFESFLSPGAGVVGTRSGLAQTSAPSPCIILFPINNGKPRGRVFLPGISIADTSGGIMSTSYKNAANALGTALAGLLTLVGGGAPVATPVIYHRATKTGVQVAHGVLSDMIGTVRRRNRPA